MRKILFVVVVLFVGLNWAYSISNEGIIKNHVFTLNDIEALSDNEYDYAVTKCKKTCDKFTGVCVTRMINGVAGVKCDYSISGTKDCCGIEVEYGTVQ